MFSRCKKCLMRKQCLDAKLMTEDAKICAGERTEPFNKDLIDELMKASPGDTTTASVPFPEVKWSPVLQKDEWLMGDRDDMERLIEQRIKELSNDEEV